MIFLYSLMDELAIQKNMIKLSLAQESRCQGLCCETKYIKNREKVCFMVKSRTRFFKIYIHPFTIIISVIITKWKWILKNIIAKPSKNIPFARYASEIDKTSVSVLRFNDTCQNILKGLRRIEKRSTFPENGINITIRKCSREISSRHQPSEGFVNIRSYSCIFWQMTVERKTGEKKKRQWWCWQMNEQWNN